MRYHGQPIRRRKHRLEYNPNSRDAPQWATYIPARSPSWKVHAKKGQAAGAVSNAVNSSGTGQSAILYEFVNGKWVERGRNEPVEFCAHCGDSTHHYKKLLEHPGKYMFEKPFVCSDCYNEHFKPGAKSPIDPKLIVVPK